MIRDERRIVDQRRVRGQSLRKVGMAVEKLIEISDLALRDVVVLLRHRGRAHRADKSYRREDSECPSHLSSSSQGYASVSRFTSFDGDCIRIVYRRKSPKVQVNERHLCFVIQIGRSSIALTAGFAALSCNSGAASWGVRTVNGSGLIAGVVG